MLGKLDNHLRFNELALSLRSTRQSVLASNIANADTPNYKARDFDFDKALGNALGDDMRLADTHLTLTSPRHIPGQAVTTGPADLLYRVPAQPSLDGNTVDMNTERVAFAENTMHYQADLDLISQRIKTMLLALQQ
jgi:flagellar basal-body rod protein FlgB